MTWLQAIRRAWHRYRQRSMAQQQYQLLSREHAEYIAQTRAKFSAARSDVIRIQAALEGVMVLPPQIRELFEELHQHLTERKR